MNSSPRPSGATRAPCIALFGLACCVAILSVASGCSRCGAKPTAEEADAQPATSAASAQHAGRTRRKGMRVPIGPRFAVLPGKGLSALRLGATVPTIERHMQAKCEELTKARCRYLTRAIDFELVDGVVRSIYINSAERSAGGVEPDGTPRMYGVFNGVILPDLMLGMTPEAIREHLGPAKRVEKALPNPHATEEVHHYDGMLLEYDRIARTGLLALGGIKVVK